MRTIHAVLLLFVVFQLTGCQAARRVTEMQDASVKSFDGTPIVFDAVGKGEPALVFIHGWCCNRGQWEHQVPEFASDHRVVAIDLVGHGESGDERDEWLLESFARDVETVVEHLDLDNVILVGHSMGGPVSLMAAANMPDRVVGVIGVDTLHDAEFEFAPGQIEQFASAFEADFEGTLEGFFGSMYPEGAEVNRDVLGRLMRDAKANDPQMAADLMRQFGELDARRAFADCPVAIHCINAAAPHATYVERNRKHNPRFYVVLMENVSHWPQLEKPAEFNRLLRERVEAVVNESSSAR